MKKCLCILLSLILCLSLCACGEQAPVMDGKTLVTIGGSITSLSTWPQEVANALNMKLVNAGIGGHTSADGALRFERDVLSHDPDFVIICFGTNDFYRQNGTAPRVSLEDYRANLIGFIEQLRDVDAVPILMTPPFISESASGGPTLYPEGTVNLALDTYVEAMRDIASEYEVDLIDIHKECDAYSITTFLVSDGVHLSALANEVYTDTITAYMKEHFTVDEDAPCVTQPTAPALEKGAWTKSLISFDPAAWLEVFDGTVEMVSSDNGITFRNTTGAWPEAHYNLALDEGIVAPIAGSTLHVDMTLQAAANIILFLNGATPTLAYKNDYISLTDALKKADPTLRTSGSDILGGQTIDCTIPLASLIPTSMLREDGTVLFTGVKVFVVGAAGLPLTIHDLSVTTEE